MDADSALQEITARLVNRFSPISIVLFGSYASGTPNEDSDLDLLVVVPNGTERRAQAAAMYEALRGIAFPADLLVVTPVDIETRKNEPGSVIGAAMRDGKVVFQREPKVA